MKADDVPRRRLQMLEQAASVRVIPRRGLPRQACAGSGSLRLRLGAKLEQMVLVIPATAPMRREPSGARCAGHSRARPCSSTQMTWSMNRRMFLTASSAMLSYAALPGWAATAVLRTADPDRAARRQRCIEHRRSG